MSMMVSFVLSFFPRDVLDEILNLIESVSEDFPSYSLYKIIKSTQNSLQTDLTFFPKTNEMSVVKIFQQVYKK